MKSEPNNSLSNKVSSKISRMRLSIAEKDLLEEILAGPVSYIPDPRFNRPTIMNPVMEQKVEVLPSTPVSADDEQTLFLQMNYARHRLCQARRRLMRQSRWVKADTQEIFKWHQAQLDYRSKIVTCNMGLVLSMVQRVKYPGVEFTDLISEGSMALLRATEKFDCARGFKFSTYACRAILKGFSRAAKQSYRYRSIFPTQLDTTLDKDDTPERLQFEQQQDIVDEVRRMMDDNEAELSEIEMSVVKMRFSLPDEQNAPYTLKEVGARLGLTKERIRQIQNKALAKLRTVAEESILTA
ncbi:MAG: sigma-70 family RNA polymerase sigma factor [Sedimentisphaerales bacterium]|nr:sigma-70 family RNA polymerase sigma factor [Sedimentisphaerales bacterium]